MRSEPLTIAMVEARNVERATGLRISGEPRKRSPMHTRMAQAWGSGNRPEWQVGQGICKVCGKGFCEPGQDIHTIELWGVTHKMPTNVCDDCSELVANHYQSGADSEDDRAVSVTPKWDELCPPRFKAAVDLPAPPASVDAEKLAYVTAWRPAGPEKKGLYILGPSGTGKTTAFWSLARELEKAGTTPVVLTSLELSRVLQEAARDIRDVVWLTRCRVLMIDDLGKERATPAASALLWEVLDRRYGHGLPCIFTSRFPSKDLAARFGEESIGQDIIRRLFDVCEGVKFSIQNDDQKQAA